MARIRPEDHQQRVDENDRETDEQDELIVLRPPDERLHDDPLQGPADDEEQRRDRNGREDRIEMQRGEQDEGRVHRQHGELAMGEIDDAHDPEDDGKPERHQAVDEAGQHALDEDFEVEGKGHSVKGAERGLAIRPARACAGGATACG